VPVNVVNTAAHAVPITVTNTPSVTVANTPSVTVANTPSVTIANTPSVTVSNPVQLAGPVEVSGTVTVANQPSAGSPWWEVLGVTINVAGGVAGPPGSAVPPGKRRIITSISARWVCDSGHRALVQLFGNINLFLPGQYAYTFFGRDTYSVVTQVNIMQDPGTQWVPIIEGDGGTCQADFFVSGVQVPL
jgi:hypothetical protein